MSELAEAQIARTATSPDFAVKALDLYRRLDTGRQYYDEPVDYGSTGLYVDTGRGEYDSVIWALGIRDIARVEANELLVDNLEERIRRGRPAVDSVFVLSMPSKLIDDMAFIGAAAASARPRGVLVTSFESEPDFRGFYETVRASPHLMLRGILQNPLRRPPAKPPEAYPAHPFLCLWRRVPGIIKV